MPAEGHDGVRVILATVPTDGAASLARALVESGDAACVNLIPTVQSVYRWKGDVVEDGEALLILKTAASRVDSLMARFEELHPYDLPEFLVLPVEAGIPAYLAWVAEATGSHPMDDH